MSDLPNRRDSNLMTFTHDGFVYQTTYSFDADGNLAEIFLDTGKSGTAIRAMAADLGVVASKAFQRGASFAEIHSALNRHEDNSPAGPLAAALDLIARDSQ